MCGPSFDCLFLTPNHRGLQLRRCTCPLERPLRTKICRWIRMRTAVSYGLQPDRLSRAWGRIFTARLELRRRAMNHARQNKTGGKMTTNVLTPTDTAPTPPVPDKPAIPYCSLDCYPDHWNKRAEDDPTHADEHNPQYRPLRQRSHGILRSEVRGAWPGLSPGVGDLASTMRYVTSSRETAPQRLRRVLL